MLVASPFALSFLGGRADTAGLLLRHAEEGHDIPSVLLLGERGVNRQPQMEDILQNNRAVTLQKDRCQ